MLTGKLQRKLDRLLRSAQEITPGPGHRLVIFSDLHLGDGGASDDFKKNGELFLAAMRRYYLKKKFTLVLNGDIEELARFRLKSITARWAEVYRVWGEFAARGALVKLVGNHDLGLLRRGRSDLPFPVVESLQIRLGGKLLFVMHGHQTSNLNWAFQTFGILFLRWLLRPLGIGNYTVARSSRRRFKVEKRMYGFARKKKIMALIGHTHRPLFESLSRLESLKVEIENLCRKYPRAAKAARPGLERQLERLKAEFVKLQGKDRQVRSAENLYHDGPLLPCLFNSGCGIGRHGVTGIEIVRGRAALVYWVDRGRTDKYFDAEGYEPQRLGDSDFYRIVLKEEDLDYIFTRIDLLG